MRLLNAGFDGLDVAFQGRLGTSVLQQLADAKEEARQRRAPVLVMLGPGQLPCHVAAAGAGAYSYLVDTGFDGEKWFFQQTDDPEAWGIFVSVKSAALAFHKYKAVRERLYARLEQMGATVLAESLNRVDFCFDWLAPEIAGLDPWRMVCRQEGAAYRVEAPQKTAKKKTLEAARGPGRRFDDPPERALEPVAPGTDVEFRFRGGNVTSLRVGDVTDLQMAVYHKRKEIFARRNKSFWWEIWGLDPDDPANVVWRVEMRAGKRCLKETWDITTFEQLEALVGDVVRWALKKIRYCAPAQSDSNRSRWVSHELWTETQVAAGRLLEAQGIVSPKRVIVAERVRVERQFGKMLAGMALAWGGVNAGRLLRAEILPEMAKRLVEAVLAEDPTVFDGRLRAVLDRYIFLDAGHYDDVARCYRAQAG